MKEKSSEGLQAGQGCKQGVARSAGASGRAGVLPTGERRSYKYNRGGITLTLRQVGSTHQGLCRSRSPARGFWVKNTDAVTAPAGEGGGFNCMENQQVVFMTIVIRVEKGGRLAGRGGPMAARGGP